MIIQFPCLELDLWLRVRVWPKKPKDGRRK